VFFELLCVVVSTVQANEALPWLRWLVAFLSPRRYWFDPRSVSFGSVVDKVALGQVSVLVLRFFPVSVIAPILRAYLHLNTAAIRSTSGR